MQTLLHIVRPLCRPTSAQVPVLPGSALWLFCICAYVSGDDGAGRRFSNYYLGAIGKYPIQLGLAVEDGKASGHYFYESIGKPISLKGTLGEEDTLSLEECVNKTLTGRFRGKLKDLRRSVEGEWSSPDGKRHFPFLLRCVAEYVRVESRSSQATITLESTIRYPRLLKASEAFKKINATLKARGVDLHRDFLDDDLGDYDLEPMRWCQDYDTSIVHYSDSLISVRADTYLYTGGAHGNTGHVAANFWISDGEAKELSLNDMLSSRPGTFEALSAQVNKEMRRLKGVLRSGMETEYEDIDFEEKDFAAFTLSPKGLEIAFAPYHVGSYAEGSYFVLLPFSSLGGILETSGPARPLICRR